MTYEELENKFISSLTLNDTLVVLQAGDSLMNALKNGDIESSIKSLYMIDNNKLMCITDEKAKELITRFKHYPVIDYHLTHCVFSVPSLNDLKYTITFSKYSNKGKNPSIPFVLNPVKMDDGKWYLCIKGEQQASKDMHHPIHPKTPVQ